MKINSKSSLYCIFGNPVGHSLSPVIHNTAFEKNDINAVYIAFEVSNIEDAIISMKNLGIQGASITIPFKVDVIKYIDEIDPLAQKIGSVNTLINIKNKITGYNTDGFGALKALKNNHVNVSGSRTLVLGNGGSARAIAFTLLENNSEIIIAGRNMERVNTLTTDLKSSNAGVSGILLEDLDVDFMKSVDVIINTTPMGMHPKEDEIPIGEELLHKKHCVFDIVYSPDETKLLKSANKKGCTIVKGIEMLIYQGIKQFELWTGIEPGYEEIFKAVNMARGIK